MHIGGQMSTSLTSGIVVAEVHAEFEQPPTTTTSPSRQPPPAAAAAETAAAKGLTHDLRMREVRVNVEQDGGGEGGVPRSNRGHSVAMKALKLHYSMMRKMI